MRLWGTALLTALLAALTALGLFALADTSVLNLPENTKTIRNGSVHGR